MYRNSQDKRVKHTSDLLFHAVCDLMIVKKFSAIGIKEVCEKAGVGRATFYRNFDYVEDILSLKLDEKFEELQFLEPLPFNPNGEPILLFFEFCTTNCKILEILYEADKWEIFNRRSNTATIQPLTDLSEMAGITHTHLDYLQASTNGLFTAVLHTWLEKGKKETAAQLFEIFELPFKLHRYQRSLLENK